MPKLSSPIRPPARHGFTLVEVVIALAILVFAGFGLVSLLAVGLQSNRDSREQLQAATLAEFYCSVRRAAPTTSFTGTSSPEPNFPIPVLSTTAGNLSSPTYVTWDGAATTLTSGNARFGLLYNITAPANYVPSTSPGIATMYLCIFWPPQASTTSAGTGHFELTTTFALP
jgi:prepilin-type N-terminal cleavage/methylation domain-containing protein